MLACGRHRLALAAAAACSLPVSGPAVAAEAGAQAGTIEQVIVTARRREESLQDVPVAITALTADQLLEQNVRTLEDMTAYAPNIKVNAGRATTSTINAYIRGVGQNDPLWGFEPGVGIYLDDVYIARPQGALLDVYDVERIEVLRGPQGTLYGKNTIAGAIKYVTRDIATEDPAFNVTATGGSYNQRDIKVGGSAPVVADHVYLGAAVAYLQRDGYGELVDDGAPRAFNQRRPGRLGQGRARGARQRHVRVGRKLEAARARRHDPGQLERRRRPAPEQPRPAGARRSLRPAHRHAGRPDRFISKGVAATYTQGLSDALDLKLVGAYREGDGRQFIDFEELNANLFQVPAEYSDDQTSGEVQLTYTGDTLKGVAGVYYFDGTARGAFDASLGASQPHGADEGQRRHARASRSMRTRPGR